MKKFIFCMMMLMASVLSVNAQKSESQLTYFESGLTDNVYVGINGGVSTPLTFNSVFPLNSQASIRVGKDFTPIFGVFVEGTAGFGDNIGYGHEFCYSHTFVKASNVGLNSTINWMNLLCGYKGSPRTFEITSVAGLGWSHYYGRNDGFDKTDDLTAKTALDFNINFGNDKQWQFFVEPGVFWNLTGTDKVQFNKNYAHLALNVGLNYKFDNSYNTHNFRTIDVAKLNDEINFLRAENEALKNRKPEVIEKIVTKVEKVETVKTTSESTFAVTFTQGSAELSDAAKAILDQIPSGKNVEVTGCTSPEGTVKVNTKLAAARANAAADYLKSRGVNVKGVTKADAGRAAVVTIK